LTRVMILGGSGMLGSMLVDVFASLENCRLTASVRDSNSPIQRRYPQVQWLTLDSSAPDPAVFQDQDWIINAIGITKPLIKDDNEDEIQRAIQVNSVFPHHVGRLAGLHGAQVIQIATDCVYSGAQGRYLESAVHDALDVYGKTKSLGETYLTNVHHLRCSIIGPEPKDFKFLIEWFRKQPQEAQLNGFRNHSWNGVTTLHFARLCRGIISRGVTLGHLQHVIPSGHITKAEMLHEFAAAYHRPDIRINDVDAKVLVDRTLETNYPAVNAALWTAAGYSEPPTVETMIQELATYPYRGAGEATV
jgi:dTDP-4-dehydrorhamnose reductase